MARPTARRALRALVAVPAAAALLLPAAPALAAGTAATSAAACPREGLFGAAGTGLFGATDCTPASTGAESYAELAAANGQRDARATAPLRTAPDGAYAAGLAQRNALAAAGATTPGSWTPLGTTPLDSAVAAYPRVAGLGLNQLSGRVEDLAVDPADPQHLLAATAGGGVWETTTAGSAWRSIGDALPTQVTGAVAFAGGAIVVGTGDPAYGGSSNQGLGIFRTTNDGASWTHSDGSPTSGLTFVVKARPGTDGSTLYAGTSKGLFVSTDAGATFTNANLPTGCTRLTDPSCFFANMVTDVALPKSSTRVVAAVGWRAGQKPNAAGTPQAPQNGLYVSATGLPGSFTYQVPTGTGAVGTPGFGRVVNGENFVGRTTLAVAPQNPNYLVAMVEDAGKFASNSGVSQLDTVYAAVPKNTVLDGLYASGDGGATWTKIIDAAQLASPDTGTALIGANTASYAPGVQGWYNQWIEFDPTHTNAAGQPDRVAFGLEEVWQTTLTVATGAPQTTASAANTQVIGSYFAGGSCGGLSLGLPACPLDPRTPAAHTTTHPDQHAGLFVPDVSGGGVTLYVGNDGGVEAQHVGASQDFSQAGWGVGLQGGRAGFLHTTQPYQVVGAKDGTLYMGLQDNGQAKIISSSVPDPDGLPGGKQVDIFGGDGFYSATDPNNSKVTYEEYTNGAISVSVDGGKTWTANSPALTSSLFATPFVMDPYDARHLLTGGRDIKELTAGPTGTWAKVFDLGTQQHPGDAAQAATTTDPVNQTSAVDLQGRYGYVGYCGACDLATQAGSFGSGIATNVTGAWHIAPAAGLPKRYITGIHADPANPAVVYVTLGGYGRRWIPPGALGDDISKIGTGHLYKSTDGGASFVDISGALPDVPANDVLPRGNSLLVATDVGVFSSADKDGNGFTVLGTSLPNVSVFKLEPQPQAGVAPTAPTSRVLAATYGRGAYAFDFPTALAGAGGPTPVVPEAPLAALLPLAAAGLAGGLVWRRRRATTVATAGAAAGARRGRA